MSDTAEIHDTVRIVPRQSPAPSSIDDAAPTVHVMLNRALATGNLDLADRYMQIIQRRAFNIALAAAHAELPAIVKNAIGHNNRRYADLAAITSTVRPILSKHGIRLNFRPVQEGSTLTVSCVLTHDDGHSEETSLSGPNDTSGSKNAIQSIGSAATYLSRYTLMMALGLAATDDDDGHASGVTGATISQKQLDVLRDLADELAIDLPAYCRVLKVPSLADIPADKFDAAKALMERKRQ